MLRHSLAGFLTLLLILTGQQAALARGAAPTVGQAVICIGHQVVVVHLDADGQPVEEHHLCPDLALMLFAGIGLPLELPEPELAATTARWTAFARQHPPMQHVTPAARGPPAPV